MTSKSATSTRDLFAATPHMRDNETNEIEDLTISIKNGIATLSGTTVSRAHSLEMEFLIFQMQGVKQTINLISHKHWNT